MLRRGKIKLFRNSKLIFESLCICKDFRLYLFFHYINKSINDIAESCGFSRQKVWRVINNLEKNHTIWGYVAVVDEEKLDKKSYIILLKRTNKSFSQELINKIIKRELTDKGKN